MIWILIIVVVLAIAFVKWFPKRVGKPIEDLPDTPLILMALLKRAETAIEQLDTSHFKYDPFPTRNEINITNLRRAVERCKRRLRDYAVVALSDVCMMGTIDVRLQDDTHSLHDPTKLREIVDDLETWVKFNRQYGGARYTPEVKNDPELKAALIASEEITRRIKTILGSDYKDPYDCTY